MILLTVLGFLVLTGWMCIVLYQLVLSIISWMTNQREAPLIHPRHHFALLIPAENAEKEIGAAIERLTRSIKYPRSMFDFIVIPVDCTDRTTTVARQKGATVYGPGKRKWRDRDEAVQTVFERLAMKRRYDAYVLLDVAVDVSPDFLSVLSDKLSKGALIIQPGYRIEGPIHSWREGLIAGLRAISPSLHTVWISRFRYTAGLRRLGICASRSLVEKYGVRSPALTDDPAYTIRLLADNVTVVYAPKAMVMDHGHVMPASCKPPSEKNTSRWHLARQYALPLIREGLQWRSTAQVIGGLNLLIPPFSWMFSGALIWFALTLVIHAVVGYPLSNQLMIGWGMVVGMQALLALNRLAYTRAPFRAYLTLPALPVYMLWQAGRSRLQTDSDEAVDQAYGQRAESSTDGSAMAKQRVSGRRRMRRSTSG